MADKKHPHNVYLKSVGLALKAESYAHLEDLDSAKDLYEDLIIKTKDYLDDEDIKEIVSISWCKYGITLCGLGYLRVLCGEILILCIILSS